MSLFVRKKRDAEQVAASSVPDSFARPLEGGQKEEHLNPPLFLATLCFILLPELICSVLLCLFRHSLALPLVYGIRIFCLIIGLFFLFQAVGKSMDGNCRRGNWFKLQHILRFMPVLFCYLLFPLVFGFGGIFLIRILPSSPILCQVILAIIGLFIVLLMGIAFWNFAAGYLIPRPNHPVRRFFQRFPYGILLSLFFMIATLIPQLVSWFQKQFFWHRSLSIHFILLIAASLLSAVLLRLVLYFCRKMANIKKQTATSSAPTEPSADSQEEATEVLSQEHPDLSSVSFAPAVPSTPERSFSLINCIALIFCLVLAGITYLPPLITQPVNEAAKTVANHYQLAWLDAAALDYDGAALDLDRAKALMQVWSVASGNSNASYATEAQIAKLNDTSLTYINALQNGDTHALEAYLRQDGFETQMSLALLDLYAERGENLSEQEQIYRRAALADCIADGDYTVSWIRPADVAGKSEQLENAFAKYGIITEYDRVLSVLVRSLHEENYSNELLSDALQLAADYPANWSAQYMAAKIGSACTYDGASHYDATAEAIKRYGKLFPEAIGMSEENQSNLQLQCASMLASVYHYEDALTYLEPLMQSDASEEAFSLTAQCYERLGKLDQCEEAAVQHLETNPQSAEALYYAALSAIRSGKADVAIEMTSHLASSTSTAVGSDAVAKDKMLFVLLEFLSFNDDAQYTGFQHEIYSKLTEMQRASIDSNPFFADYLDAVYFCYANRDAGHNETALSRIEKILAANNSLPQAWFLKGIIYFQIGNEADASQASTAYQQSKEAFLHSLSLAPDSASTWYALANTYDALEEYQPAIEACETCLSLLPNQDHGNDWYGVSTHCKNLLNALQNKVG